MQQSVKVVKLTQQLRKMIFNMKMKSWRSLGRKASAKDVAKDAKGAVDERNRRKTRDKLDARTTSMAATLHRVLLQMFYQSVNTILGKRLCSSQLFLLKTSQVFMVRLQIYKRKNEIRLFYLFKRLIFLYRMLRNVLS